jgi:hypothetical protein
VRTNSEGGGVGEACEAEEGCVSVGGWERILLGFESGSSAGPVQKRCTSDGERGFRDFEMTE